MKKVRTSTETKKEPSLVRVLRKLQAWQNPLLQVVYLYLLMVDGYEHAVWRTL